MSPEFVNLRDLGGRALPDGRTLPKHRLYRSGHFSNVPGPAISAWGVRTAIDLREPPEIDAMPSAWPGEVRVLAPARDEVVGYDNREMLTWRQDMTLEDARRHRARLYARKPMEFRGGTRAVFLCMGNVSAYPIVFHCMAGKDRTGFLSAVILKWLGVDHESIMADYLRSAEAVGRFTAEQVQKLVRVYGIEDQNPDVFRAMTEVHPDYLNAALDAIDQRHGGIEGYLREAVGLTDAQLGAAREHLLSTGSGGYGKDI